MTISNKHLVLLLPVQLGKSVVSQMATMLEAEGNQVVIYDEEVMVRDSVKLIIERQKEYSIASITPMVGPKSDFEQRQEWLDKIRKKHQRRNFRSLK